MGMWQSTPQLPNPLGAGNVPKLPESAIQKGLGMGRSGTSVLSEHPRVAVALLVAVVISLVALTVAALMLWQRAKQRQQGGAGTTALSQMTGLGKDRLSRVWRAFHRQLPPSVHESLTDYGHFVVLGSSGAGKSALISRMTDWQGQSHQFLPSLTSDPLLQIYLGNQLVVQELSAALLQTSTNEVSEILRKLLSEQPSTRPVVVVVVLSVAMILEATPDKLRQHAQLTAGKLSLIAQETAGPLQVRICLTGMDRLPGYSALARAVHSQQQEMSVDLSARAQSERSELFSTAYHLLPKLLVTQPVTSFESVISFLQVAPQQLRPLLEFVATLEESSPVGKRTELERLYFTSLRPEEQVGNPFVIPPRSSRAQLTMRSHGRWWNFGRQIPGHASASAGLSLILIAGCLFSLIRHQRQIQAAESALEELNQTTARARSTGGEFSRPAQSELVHRATQRVQEEFEVVWGAEARLSPLRFVFRDDKARLRAELAESLRNAYFLPALQIAIRQRSRQKVLYALAAVYASHKGALGGLLRGQAEDFARQLGIPETVQREYLRVQDRPFPDPVLATLPELSDGIRDDVRRAIESPVPWQTWLRSLLAAVTRSALSQSELSHLRSQTDKLHSTMVLLRRERELGQLYRLLVEESPLDMATLFGKAADSLSLGSHLADNQETFEALAQLILNSTERLANRDRSSLLQLLRWVSAERPKLEGLREVFVMTLEGERFEIAKEQWLDLLLRSRKRQLLGDSPSRQRHKRSKRPAHSLLRKGTQSSPIALALKESRPREEDVTLTYSRASFEQDISPLLHELDKALGTASTLSEAEKLTLARLVRDEVRRFARLYCQAQTAYLLAYHPDHGSASQVRAVLLGLLKQGSPLLARLRVVVDNIRLPGLDSPLLRPLAECLAPLQPLVPLLTPGKEGELTALAPYRAATESLLAELSGTSAAEGGDGDPTAPKPTEIKGASQGESEGGDQQVTNSVPDSLTLGADLLSQLSPLAKTAFKLRSPRGGSRQQVERFLDGAGIGGELRKPFLRPLLVVYQMGHQEIEQAAARLLREQIAPPLESLLQRFPFTKTAQKEATFDEIEKLLHPKQGLFWKSLRAGYGGLLQEQEGAWRSTVVPGDELPAPRLPSQLWPLLHRAEHLRSVLYGTDGTPRPLRFQVRALPIPQPRTPRALQPSLSFLRVGGAEVLGFHQQQSSKPLMVDWRNQGVASVGIEYTAIDSNRKQTQSLEVSDSAWSLYRLLSRAAIKEASGVYWQLVRESETSRWSLGFVFEPDPWTMLQGPASSERSDK